MDPQEIRLECLSLAVEAGACPDCAVDTAEAFRAYIEAGETGDEAPFGDRIFPATGYVFS